MKKIKKTFMIIFVLVITGFISTAQNEKIPVTSSSEKAVQLYHQAWSVMENAEITKAHQLLEDALKEDPDFFMGHFVLAFNNLYFGNREVFKEHAEKALNSKAALSKGEMLLKTALRRLNENPKADVTDVGENLVKIYPSDEVAYYMLASFQGIVKDFEGSTKTYIRLLQIAENKAPVYNMMGYNYMQLNDFEAAEKAFDKYIELFPGHPNPHDSKGDFYMKVKDYPNAYSSYITANRLNKSWSYEKAMKAKNLMDDDEAALRKWMDDYVANNNRGDFENYGSFWAEDAIWMPPGAPMVSGKSSILKFAEPFFTQYKSDQKVAIEEIRFAGNLAYIRAVFNEVYIPNIAGADTIRLQNKAIFIFTKESKESWIATHCVWNYNK